MVDFREHIVIDPNIRFGKPCIDGTRISVTDILGWLASDMTIEEIIENHPILNKTQILAALAFSSERGNVVQFLKK